jgi:hypothetical protein
VRLPAADRRFSFMDVTAIAAIGIQMLGGGGRSYPSRRRADDFDGTLQIAAACLLQFQRLKQRLEVALAEGLAPSSADDLKEERGAVLQRLGEQLQEVAFVVGVDQDAQVLDALVVFFDGLVAVGGEHGVDAVPDLLVIGVGEGEEVDASGAQRGD